MAHSQPTNRSSAHRTTPRSTSRPVSAAGRPAGAARAAFGPHRQSVRPAGRAVASDGLAGARRVRGGWAGGPPAPPAPLRLTRRGRRVLGALLVALGLAIVVLTAQLVGGGAGAGRGLQLAGEAGVVVRSGDTLWSIARDVAPGEDVRGVVDALQELNDIEGSLLVPGQVLRVP